MQAQRARTGRKQNQHIDSAQETVVSGCWLSVVGCWLLLWLLLWFLLVLLSVVAAVGCRVRIRYVERFSSTFLESDEKTCLGLRTLVGCSLLVLLLSLLLLFRRLSNA